MTSNQINNRSVEEQKRSNRAKEKETERSNRTKEAETYRSNKASESLERRGQNIKGANDLLKTVSGVIEGRSKAGTDAILKLIGAANDPSWYNLDPQVVKDVASLSYFAPLGRFQTFGNHLNNVASSTSTLDGEFKAMVPGCMVLNFTPSIGLGGTDETNAANVAAKNVYAYVRYNNSGAKNYEANDLMLYLLAMDSLYIAYGHACKLYSLALTAKSQNYYYPSGIFKAMGYDIDSFTGNLANFRSWINTLAVKLNSYNVPNAMPFFDRHVWLVTNIFKDYEISKSQDYLFCPHKLYRYNDTHGYLEPVTIRSLTNSGSDMTVTDFMTVVNGMLEKVVSSEDIGIMSGDILKAYGSDKLYNVFQIQENFHIESTYSAEVLSQIQAATVVGRLTNDYIGQDANGHILTGSISSGTPYIIDSSAAYQLADSVRSITPGQAFNQIVKDKAVLNMYKDDVSPDDNMVASRLTTMIGVPDGVYSRVTSCGSEIVNQVSIVDSSEVRTNSIPFYRSVFNGFINVETTFSSVMFKSLFTYSKFDWAPILPVYLLSSTGSAVNYIGDIADFANYTVLESEVVDRMHSVALLSMFGVPLLGTAKRK